MTAALLEYPARHHYAPHQAPPTKVQVVRSVSGWSHGVLTEHRIQSEMLTAYPDIEESEHFIYVGAFCGESGDTYRAQDVPVLLERDCNVVEGRADCVEWVPGRLRSIEFIDRLFFFWDTAGRFIVLGLDYGAGRPCLTT
ncbi:hypothetical protein C8R47DRAFT_1083244 [Mycena vitilis]|nr:hypothetical protein C8R47DRAFT_1083244 [Mycena vitilis]